MARQKTNYYRHVPGDPPGRVQVITAEKPVVTYGFAYPLAFENSSSPTRVSLCKKHRTLDRWDGRPLGEVLHGEHLGYCDVCEARK